MRRLVAATAAALLAASSAGAARAPAAGIERLAELATPLPAPYDPSADAAAQVAQARARAKASGKLLLIDLGGNWCGDCRILAAVMRLPAIAAFVDTHYEVVMVDVGRMDRNLAIPARWGLRRLDGVPTLLVVDGKDRLVDVGHVEALADARSMTPQALADWLARWTD